jgi:flagellar biosynthesis/type III secretory pathway protein FliH
MENAKSDGFQQGMIKGKQDGIRIGRLQVDDEQRHRLTQPRLGEARRRAAAYQEGKAAGRLEGREEGRLQGRLEALRDVRHHLEDLR